MVCSPDGDTGFAVLVAGVLQRDTLAPYLFILCLEYVLQTSTDLIKGIGLTSWTPAQCWLTIKNLYKIYNHKGPYSRKGQRMNWPKLEKNYETEFMKYTKSHCVQKGWYCYLKTTIIKIIFQKNMELKIYFIWAFTTRLTSLLERWMRGDLI